MAERTEKRRTPNAIQRYTRETIGELRKVTWPTTQEAMNLTKIVLITLAAMAMLLGLLDYVFSLIVTRLLVV
jgi:preprotein translocase subunit SecE